MRDSVRLDTDILGPTYASPSKKPAPAVSTVADEVSKPAAPDQWWKQAASSAPHGTLDPLLGTAGTETTGNTLSMSDILSGERTKLAPVLGPQPTKTTYQAPVTPPAPAIPGASNGIPPLPGAIGNLVTVPDMDKKPEQTTRRTAELSWKDYNNLSDDQRGAVDINTLLVNAREKDVTADYKPTDQQKQMYDTAFHDVFGNDADEGKTYAPSTVAVLDQLNWKPIEGKDGDSLDDFLNLKVVVDAKDLVNLERLGAGQTASTLADVDRAAGSGGLTDVQSLLVDGANALTETLAKSHALLQNFNVSAEANQQTDLRLWGGKPNKFKPAPGYAEMDPSDTSHYGVKNSAIQSAYERLAADADKKDTSFIMEHLQPYLMSVGVPMSEFMQYADQRSAAARDYGMKLGAGNSQYRSPEDFRKLLGLDGGSDDQ